MPGLHWVDVIAMIAAGGCVGIFAMFAHGIWSDRGHRSSETGRNDRGAAADGTMGWSGSAVGSGTDGGGCDGGGDA